MSKAVKRRYNFVLKDIPTREEFLIKNYFGDELERGKTNYVLSAIDMITLNYNNEEELLEDMNLIFGYDVSHPKFHIKYKENKKERYLKIAYKDLDVLKQYAKERKTNVDVTPEYKKFYNHFMTNIQKGRFYRYMVENHYVNKRLHKLLEEYLYEDKIYREQEIYEHLRNYRVIRDYIFGITEYNKTVINDEAKISLNSIKSRTQESVSDKIIRPKNNQLKLSTDDPFLNTLTDRDEITRYYDLEQLETLVDDDKIFDGLGKSEEPKKLILKRNE
jgi:hypothetical protein